MLIEFSVKNYRSIKNLATFSMVAGKGAELLENNTFTVSIPNADRLARTSVIYGANASGKSNLIKAMQSMHALVVNSAQTKIGKELSVEPFKLSSESQKEPTFFEIMFVSEGVQYQYGFTATTKRIEEEWLFAFPNGYSQNWFQRSFNKDINSYDWVLGSKLKGRKQVWVDSTKENCLFLSMAVHLNSDQLAPVYNWFREKFHVSSMFDIGMGYTSFFCDKDKGNKLRVTSLLKDADFDILDLGFEKKKFSEDQLPEDMPASIKKHILETIGDKDLIETKTYHKSETGDLVEFSLDDESDGTQKFYGLLGPILDVLDSGSVLIVDELSNSLHTNLMKAVIKLFNDSEINKKNAQLIFTTHDTAIMNQKVFRRDQVWFSEKDKNGGSNLYSLTEFKPRKDKENIELAYLSGRYGALPTIQGFFVRD